MQAEAGEGESFSCTLLFYRILEHSWMEERESKRMMEYMKSMIL
jgi:hypothetical protein